MEKTPSMMSGGMMDMKMPMSKEEAQAKMEKIHKEKADVGMHKGENKNGK